jgi:hypothetical protein
MTLRVIWTQSVLDGIPTRSVGTINDDAVDLDLDLRPG